MALVLSGPAPEKAEDSVTRLATPASVDNRGILTRYDRRTQTLIDGPQAGQTVDYWVPVVSVEDGISVDLVLPPALNSTSIAYQASRVVKATPGFLYGLTGFNSGPSQFIQVFDSASVPTDTAVPSLILYAGAASSFSLDFGLRGRSFSVGISLSNSSTGPTKTIGSADCWFDVQYG